MTSPISNGRPFLPQEDAESQLRGAGSKDDAAAASRKFEALILHELMKAMRATVPKDEEEYGFGRQMADDMFDQAITDSAAGGLGLSAVLERELGGKGGGTGNPEGNPGLRPALPSLPHAASVAHVAPGHAGHAHGARPRVGALGTGVPQAGLTPTEGTVSSKFGWREHPIEHTRKFHAGVDIAAPEGTEIKAVQSGTVVFAGVRSGYGKTVEIRHPDGAVTRYAHASRIHVQKGDRVEVGESVADVGSSGQATGAHLHFEARIDGKAVNPETYLKRLRGQRATWHGK